MLRHGVEILEPLWAAHPEQARFGERLAGAHNNLGHLLSDIGCTAEAEAAFQRRDEIIEAINNPSQPA